MKLDTRTRLTLTVAFCAGFGGCSSVPPEAVDLSYQIGKDTEALHQSYRKLIQAHYDMERHCAEENWTSDILPQIVKKALAEGRLVDVVSGRVVWDPARKRFVPPTPGLEYVQMEQSIQVWSREISGIMDKSRNAMLAPYDAQEEHLVHSVDSAFAQINRGNAAISAFLTSMRHVQQSQDTLLDRAGLKEARDEIRSDIAKLSEDASKGSAGLEKARIIVEKWKANAPQENAK